MRNHSLWQLSTVLLGALLLSGCVTIPDSVRGTSPTPQQDLTRVMAAPELFIGQESRFGGRVVNVTNKTGQTRLELAAMPLDDGARPILGSASVGRIYADLNGFVDPVDVKDKLITVVGLIKGTEKGTIGKVTYNFLVVSVTGYQRWHLTQQIVTPPQPIAPWIFYEPDYPRHRGYWGPPPWGGYYYNGPSRVETILTE